MQRLRATPGGRDTLAQLGHWLAAIKRALRLPSATDLSYLVAPEHEMGLGVTSLEARYYLITSNTFEDILTDAGLVGRFSRVLLQCSMRKYGFRLDTIARTNFSAVQNTWLRKLHILRKLGMPLELPPEWQTGADELIMPQMVSQQALHVPHARQMWHAGFYRLEQCAQPGLRQPFSAAEFNDSYVATHGQKPAKRLVAAYAHFLPHPRAHLATLPPLVPARVAEDSTTSPPVQQQAGPSAGVSRAGRERTHTRFYDELEPPPRPRGRVCGASPRRHALCMYALLSSSRRCPARRCR